MPHFFFSAADNITISLGLLDDQHLLKCGHSVCVELAEKSF